MDEQLSWRLSWPRALAFQAASGLLGWSVAQVALALVTGGAPAPGQIAVSGAVFIVAFTVFAGLALRYRRPSVRVTGAALELADRGTFVGLPWPLIRSAEIRHPGPLATLRVTLHPGTPTPPPGALRPRLRAGHPTYQLHVGVLHPAPATLRTALARHLPPRP
ncbi:hypothetical protein [Micromonospora auratinigra]|uniref:PH domain-containing protein n=1 Tax=Micromonospora auratinigra TaxID=261654 RepID=A0A1A8ZDV0_9ACTN|nr:hypothetical protein [Micromonospora auratinigra]SBT42170.1 hypothetical protein GA0070611_1885 [Micromonospora auratinigra]